MGLSTLRFMDPVEDIVYGSDAGVFLMVWLVYLYLFSAGFSISPDHNILFYPASWSKLSLS
jgi:hypothetical protein